MTGRIGWLFGFGAALLLTASGARAQALAWDSVASEDVIEILTYDPDGDLRETTVWVGVVDGTGYVRTSDSRWQANIERDANVVVRVADREYPLRADRINDAELRARVNEVFRAKYGFVDRLLSWFGNDGGKVCFALVRRSSSD